MTLFDILTVKAKKSMATFLNDVEYDEDAKDDEFDNWWEEFTNGEFSWIAKKNLTPENLEELRDVNRDYCEATRTGTSNGWTHPDPCPDVKLNVSVKEMLWRYKLWKCDPDDWNNYSLLMDMFEEQWNAKFP